MESDIIALPFLSLNRRSFTRRALAHPSVWPVQMVTNQANTRWSQIRLPAWSGFVTEIQEASLLMQVRVRGEDVAFPIYY